MLTPAAPRRMRGPAQRGFSLIELMVTITILGFLLLTTLPSIGAWMRNTEIRNAAESIASGLAKARNEAVRRNQTVRFALVSNATDNPGLLDNSCALSITSASWVVSLDSPAGGCAQAVSETTAPRILAKWARGDGSPNVAIRALNSECNAAASAQVGFGGFGRIDTTVTTTPVRCIEITHRAGGSGLRPLRIVLATGGTARMCDPAVSDANDPRKC